MAKHILAVDDDPNVRKLMQVTFISAGYVIAAVANGVEALGAMQKDKPDLVILDINMPDMDGWEVCKQIRDEDERHAIKILMLTARNNPRDQLVGTEIFRADGYMTKPFIIDDLLFETEKLLQE
jgi:DNA-binding response OmpR family regulator